jgi:uncharacterized protein (UPF0333 family)
MQHTAHSTQQTAKRGQAIIEYLLVAAAIIVALVAVAGVVGPKAEELMRGAVNQVPSFPGSQ